MYRSEHDPASPETSPSRAQAAAGATPVTVAVVGSTGQLGRAAVAAFAARGHRVLACARGPQEDLPAGAEARTIDVTRPETIPAALEGAQVVHLSLSGGDDPERIRAVEDEGVRQVVAAAHAAGATRLTMISGMFARPEYAGHPGEGAKVQAEQHLLASPIDATIYRPAFFAETLERFVQNGRGMLLGSQPHTFRPIITEHLMADIERGWSLPETIDRVFEVTGVEPTGLRQALRRYLDATRPVAGLSVMPLWFMGPVNRVFLKGKLTRTLDTMRLMQSEGEIADPTDHFRVFGTPPTGFSTWLGQQTPREP